jgi:hypothetical protein
MCGEPEGQISQSSKCRKSELFLPSGETLVLGVNANLNGNELRTHASLDVLDEDATHYNSNTIAAARARAVECLRSRIPLPPSILSQTAAPPARITPQLSASTITVPLPLGVLPIQCANSPSILHIVQQQEIHQRDGARNGQMDSPHLHRNIMFYHREHGYLERETGARIPIAARMEFDHAISISERKVVAGPREQ